MTAKTVEKVRGAIWWLSRSADFRADEIFCDAERDRQSRIALLAAARASDCEWELEKDFGELDRPVVAKRGPRAIESAKCEESGGSGHNSKVVALDGGPR